MPESSSLSRDKVTLTERSLTGRVMASSRSASPMIELMARPALAGAAVLAAEAAAGVHLLGKAFEKFDWSEGSVE